MTFIIRRPILFVVMFSPFREKKFAAHPQPHKGSKISQIILVVLLVALILLRHVKLRAFGEYCAFAQVQTIE